MHAPGRANLSQAHDTTGRSTIEIRSLSSDARIGTEFPGEAAPEAEQGRSGCGCAWTALPKTHWGKVLETELHVRAKEGSAQPPAPDPCTFLPSSSAPHRKNIG